MDAAERFLDLACLTYTPEDGPPRREEARSLLESRPELPLRSVHVAAAVGDAVALAGHLSSDPDLARAPGPRGREPLLELAYSRVLVPGADPPACARLLLGHGADPDACFRLGGCRFDVLAGIFGEGERGLVDQPPHPRAEELARSLLAAGANPNAAQALYDTMFTEGDRWLVLLLEHGLDAEARVDWDSPAAAPPRTLDFLLAHAAGAGFAARVELLLAHGADPRIRDFYSGRGLVLEARLGGHEALAARLLAAGAEEEPTAPGGSPSRERLLAALLRGDSATAREALATLPSGVRDAGTVLVLAGRGRRDALELLLDLGAGADAARPDGTTALHEAALHGREDCVRLLLERGADPARRDGRFGATPAAWADHGGHHALAALLRERGGTG